MREADLTHGERWRPLAQHLAALFAVPGDSDRELVRTAMAAALDAERRLGPRRADVVLLIIPAVTRALRRHRRAAIRRGPGGTPRTALRLAITAAEIELSRSLRRSPTVAEVAAHLDVAQHQIVAGLEAGWPVGPDAVAIPVT
ncbi:hypothetical protein [Actinoplanes sp. NPDC051851]|uniref:hypothetical protein n=1 Tax=Actinoplanes sp. NPDC051851 TaxID=3154753 RepID=UPI00343ED0F2